ncbi:MAG: hypothetical protein J7L14_00650 [Candidatus Diapherotrites archaeon]|nr:hypothetical protein [Candidatus Diapherotrites archaeon]
MPQRPRRKKKPTEVVHYKWVPPRNPCSEEWREIHERLRETLYELGYSREKAICIANAIVENNLHHRFFYSGERGRKRIIRELKSKGIL